MDWMNQLGGILQQYTQGQPSATAEDDFDNISRTAPKEEVAHGLAESFRSSETPPFPQMLSQMFGNASGSQRASILNNLLAAAGPAVLSQIMGRLGGGGQQTHVTPEEAEQISPEVVRHAAEQAEQHDPSIIDRVSQIYAEQPQLVKTLGAAALTVAIAQLGRKHKLL